MQFCRLPLDVALLALISLAVVTAIPVKNSGELSREERSGTSWWNTIKQYIKPVKSANDSTTAELDANTTTVDAMEILDAFIETTPIPSSKPEESSKEVTKLATNMAENSQKIIALAKNISKTEVPEEAENPVETLEDDVNAAHKEPKKVEEVVTGNELRSGFKLKTAPTETVTGLLTNGTVNIVTEDIASINTTKEPREVSSRDELFDKSRVDTVPVTTFEEHSDTFSTPTFDTTTQATEQNKKFEEQIKEMSFVKPSQTENTSVSPTLTTERYIGLLTTSLSDDSKNPDKFEGESKISEENFNPYQSDMDMMKNETYADELSTSRIKDFHTNAVTPKAEEKKQSTAPPTETSQIEAEIAKLDSFSEEISASKERMEAEAAINGIFATINDRLEIPTEKPSETTKNLQDENKIAIFRLTGTKAEIPIEPLEEQFEQKGATTTLPPEISRTDADAVQDITEATTIFEGEKLSEDTSVDSNFEMMNTEPEMLPTTFPPASAAAVDVVSDQNAEKEDTAERSDVDGTPKDKVVNYVMRAEKPMLTTKTTTAFEETVAPQSGIVEDLEKLAQTNDGKFLPASELESWVTTLSPKFTTTDDATQDIEAEETEAELPMKKPDPYVESTSLQDENIEQTMLTTLLPEIAPAEAVSEQKNDVLEMKDINASNTNATKDLSTSLVITTPANDVASDVAFKEVAAEKTKVVEKAFEQEPTVETTVGEIVEKPVANLEKHVLLVKPVNATAIDMGSTQRTVTEVVEDFTETTTKDETKLPEGEIAEVITVSSAVPLAGTADDSVKKQNMTETKIVETTDKTAQLNKPVEDDNRDLVAKEEDEKVDEVLATAKSQILTEMPEESAEETIEDGTGFEPVEEMMKVTTEEDEQEDEPETTHDLPEKGAADEKMGERLEHDELSPKFTMKDETKEPEVAEVVELPGKTMKERTEFMFPKEEVPDDFASQHDERIPMMVGLGVGSGICLLIVVFTVACLRRRRAQGGHELVPQTEPL